MIVESGSTFDIWIKTERQILSWNCVGPSREGPIFLQAKAAQSGISRASSIGRDDQAVGDICDPDNSKANAFALQSQLGTFIDLSAWTD